MESHEEKLHNMIKISKMESARDQAKDAAKLIGERKTKQMQGIGSNPSAAGGNVTADITTTSSKENLTAHDFHISYVFLLLLFFY